MVSHGGLHRQLVLVWIGILVGASALALLELLLLDGYVDLALGATTAAAVGTAVIVTRRLIGKHRQPLITVRDLRARRD